MFPNKSISNCNLNWKDTAKLFPLRSLSPMKKSITFFWSFARIFALMGNHLMIRVDLPIL